MGSTDSLKGARLGWTACCVSHANEKSCLSHPDHCLPHCHDYHRHQQQRPQMWGPMSFFVQLGDSWGDHLDYIWLLRTLFLLSPKERNILGPTYSAIFSPSRIESSKASFLLVPKVGVTPTSPLPASPCQPGSKNPIWHPLISSTHILLIVKKAELPFIWHRLLTMCNSLNQGHQDSHSFEP